MTSFRDAIHGRAGQIAAATAAPTSAQVEAVGAAARRMHRRRIALVTAGVAGAVVVVAGVGAAILPREDAIPPATTTPSATASPSATPSPTEPAVEPAIIEGFAPVPQLPASEIPWDQVGPGWFAVDYSDGFDTGMADLEWEATPALEGGVSLLSPDGQWYAAQLHSALGNGPVEGWDGINFWMTRETVTNFESVEKRLELVNARSAEVQTVEGEAQGSLAPFEDGKALFYAWAGDGLHNSVVGRGVDGMGGCSDADAGFWGWEAQDRSFLYSPSGGGRIVCFGPYSYGTTADVTLVSVSDIASSEKINTFSRGAEQYSFVGWIDADRFFFARMGTEADPVLFRYDLRDDSITEVDLPMYRDVDGWEVTGYFDRVSQRHIIVEDQAIGEHENVVTFSIYDIDGGAIAGFDLSYLPDQGSYGFTYRTSGGRLLVNNVDARTLFLYDLATGGLLAEWAVQGGLPSVAILDAPDA